MSDTLTPALLVDAPGADPDDLAALARSTEWVPARRRGTWLVLDAAPGTPRRITSSIPDASVATLHALAVLADEPSLDDVRADLSAAAAAVVRFDDPDCGPLDYFLFESEDRVPPCVLSNTAADPASR